MFPIEFKQCPKCHSKETIAGLAIAQMEKEGKLLPSSRPTQALEMTLTPLVNPTIAVTSVPTVVTSYDVCAKCGLRYCVKADIIAGTLQYQQAGKGPSQGARPFTKGL